MRLPYILPCTDFYVIAGLLVIFALLTELPLLLVRGEPLNSQPRNLASRN